MNHRSQSPGWCSVMVLMACCGCEPREDSRSAVTNGAAAAPADPAAEAAHAALFAAADDLDLVAFKNRLSAESVALLDAAISAGAALARPPKTPPLTWEDVLQSHRSVSSAGRTRTPYRLVPDLTAPQRSDLTAPQRLDLTASPLGDLARALIESKGAAP